MKKFYEELEIEVIELNQLDVLTESDGYNGSIWDNELPFFPIEGGIEG